MRKIMIGLIFTFGFLFAAGSAHAQDGLKIELTPYLWMAGVEGDVTVGNREVEVDVGFEDLVDAVDVAGAFMTVVQYNRWVLWGQFDYLALDSNGLDNSAGRVRLESDSIFATAAFGYQFQTFGESTLDVLAGARYTRMENKLTIGGIGSGESTNDLLDGLFVLRPSFQLSRSWRFNPTLSIGTGDSDLTYELQPQFQYQVNELLAVRFGYRRLYYDVSNDRKGFDGAFHGFIAGLGFTF
jgi:hypothetical protein